MDTLQELLEKLKALGRGTAPAAEAPAPVEETDEERDARIREAVRRDLREPTPAPAPAPASPPARPYGETGSPDENRSAAAFRERLMRENEPVDAGVPEESPLSRLRKRFSSR